MPSLPLPPPPPPHLALAATTVLLLAAAASAANFTCGFAGTCQSSIGYAVPNATTYTDLLSLFNNTTTLADLLGANNLAASTPPNNTIHAKTLVRIPFRCRCTNGIGQSDGHPVYIVKPQDELDAIARNVFNAFVTYQEIATANNISNPNLIDVGKELRIPLPCSCDKVDDSNVMHFAYSVAAGNSTMRIAATYGVVESTLLRINGITDPKRLQAGQILDVPLPVCQSAINDTSPDRNLLLPKDTYAFTAQNCIQCSCSASIYQSLLPLNCSAVQATRCPAAPTCKGTTLQLGQTSGTGCAATTCAYSGYSNTTSLVIHTTLLSNQTSCKSGGSARSAFAGSSWRTSVISFHMVLILICFL